MPSKKPSNAVATRQTTLPDNFKMSDFAGSGGEEITANDLPWPALRLLQGLSHECVVGDEKFLPAAKPGMFFNSSDLNLFTGNEQRQPDDKPELVVIPVKYRNREIEFGKNRGGFVAEHLPGSPIVDGVTIVLGDNDKQIRRTANDTDLIDTSIYYVLVINPDTLEPVEAIMSLSSTAKAFSKSWNAYMRALRDIDPDTGKTPNEPPAFWSRAYTLYSSPATSKKGNHTYFVWKFKENSKLDVTNEAHKTYMVAALNYIKLIEADKVKADHSNED